MEKKRSPVTKDGDFEGYDSWREGLPFEFHSTNAYTLRSIQNYVIFLVMLNYESIR